MDTETVLPKRPRLNPYGKALRRERIFARLRGGWAYEDIAREERVTTRRVRQIVSEALQRRTGRRRIGPCDAAARPPRMQMSLLEILRKSRTTGERKASGSIWRRCCCMRSWAW